MSSTDESESESESESDDSSSSPLELGGSKKLQGRVAKEGGNFVWDDDATGLEEEGGQEGLGGAGAGAEGVGMGGWVVGQFRNSDSSNLTLAEMTILLSWTW